MPDKEEPIVVSTFKKETGPAPVFVSEGKHSDFEPVVLKYDVKKNEDKKGFYVKMPEVDLTSVALKNMADELGAYLKTEGFSVKEIALKNFISSLTSRVIYVNENTFPGYICKLAEYFTGNIFFARSAKDASILKCCYSACRNPEVIHFLLWQLEKNKPMPEYLIRYISYPSSGIEMIMNEYINDSYIGKVKLPDNIFILLAGDMDALDPRLYRQYALFEGKWKKEEKEEVEFKTISLNSLKNMHKVMDPISDTLWSKMSLMEEVLNSMSVALENKDCNHLDDYLVTLVNQGIEDDLAMRYLCDYRLFPMVSKFLDVEEFKRRLMEVSIYTSGRENS